MERVFASVDVVILTEALFDATGYIFAVDASTRLEKTSDSRDLNKNDMYRKE